MLQPDSFCDHTMQQNAPAFGAPLRTPLEELTAYFAPPDSLLTADPLAGFKGEGKRRQGWEEERRRGAGREGREIGTGPPIG